MTQELNLKSCYLGGMKLLGASIVILTIMLLLPLFQGSYAQNASNTGVQTFHSGTDTSPIEAVIMINEDQSKRVFFQPHVITIRVGGEVLVANNATSNHSVTSGSGPEDPMAGKLFDTDTIKPKAFVEYIPVNLKPGNYSFYSSTDPQIKGQLVVIPSK